MYKVHEEECVIRATSRDSINLSRICKMHCKNIVRHPWKITYCSMFHKKYKKGTQDMVKSNSCARYGDVCSVRALARSWNVYVVKMHPGTSAPWARRMLKTKTNGIATMAHSSPKNVITSLHMIPHPPHPFLSIPLEWTCRKLAVRCKKNMHIKLHFQKHNACPRPFM